MQQEQNPQPSSGLPAPGISSWYLTLGLAVTLLAFLAGLALGYLGRPLVTPDKVVEVIVTATPDGATETAPAEETNAPTLIDSILKDVEHIQGDPNAPVTIIEFSDFKCGYCGLFAVETLPKIRQNYVDTGKVRFAYKNMAVQGAESSRAAEAGECAAEQDNFWGFHDIAFADLVMVRSELNNETLIAMAEKLKLDTDAFKTCLESGRYRNKVSQDTLSVQSLGVRGTPSFLINDVFFTGAQPYEAFEQVIDEQLKAAE